MQNIPEKLKNKLQKRAEEGSLRILGENSTGVDFSSNDYLNFSTSEEIFASAERIFKNEKAVKNGATGSRLISGNHSLYSEAEILLAEDFNAESGLIFNSGYDLNLGLFSCVPQKGDFIFFDEYIHASIRDGISLSHAKAIKFKHNNFSDLKKKLKQIDDSHSSIYVVTESVFSMDGDKPNLKDLVDFCFQKKLYLIVDEAHAVGVVGAKKRGLVQELGLEKQVFAQIITFGKTFGCHGAAILGSEALKSYLVNFARSFIYTTALPPHSVATIIASLQFLKTKNASERIQKLQENISFFKSKIEALQLQQLFIESETAIQSCVISGNEKVKIIAEKLQQENFNVKPILSPTVPKGSERIRFCLHSHNSKADIEHVLRLLATFAK